MMTTHGSHRMVLPPLVLLLLAASACKMREQTASTMLMDASWGPAEDASARCYQVNQHRGSDDLWLSRTESVCIEAPEAGGDGIYLITFWGQQSVLDGFRAKVGHATCAACLTLNGLDDNSVLNFRPLSTNENQPAYELSLKADTEAERLFILQPKSPS